MKDIANDIIAALDIGSNKISIAISEIDELGNFMQNKKVHRKIDPK